MSTITCYNCAGLGFNFGIENLKWVYETCPECKGAGVMLEVIKNTMEESNVQNEIDWSTAPEGTTHYGPDSDDWHESWYKLEDGWFFFNKFHAEWMMEDMIDCNRISELTEKPESLVEGCEMFTVGNEIEYSLNSGSTWYKCEVKYIIEDSGIVAKCYFGDTAAREQYLNFSSTTFRPLNKECEERRNALCEMWNLVEIDMDVCELLYDAGYRRTAKGETK